MLLFITLVFFAILVYQKPLFAIGLILALAPTYLIRFNDGIIPTTFLELLLAVFFAITLAVKYGELGELKQLGRINWLVLLFIASGLVGVIVSPEKKAALGIFKAFIAEPVLFFYALNLYLKRPQDLRTPLNLLFIGAVFMSVFGILQHFTLIKLPLQFWGTGEEVERITSFFDYPNALALYLAPLTSFFLAGLIWNERVLNRKNLVLGLIFMVIALIFTFSRGAWIAVALTSFFFLGLRFPMRRVVPAILLIILVLFAIPATRHRFTLITHDPSSSAHVELMRAAAVKIRQNPILGNGLAGFRQTLTEQHFGGEVLNYPHNIFLNFWVEMGLLGLLSFFGIIVVAIKKYQLHHNWYAHAAAAFLLTAVIHGLVDVPYFKNDLAILFWFALSIFYIRS